MIKISSVVEARRQLEQLPLDLDAFIQLVNELLPHYLSPETADKALVSVRLARYFQTNGLLDEPFKAGREARYGARHLLQLLAVRRLMANGYSTGSLSDLLRGASDDALQRLIEGETPRVEAPEVQPVAPTSNPALDFLAQVRSRSGIPPAPASAPPPAPEPMRTALTPSLPTNASSDWTRTPIGQDIEVHLRDDFQAPQSPHEWDVLIEAFKVAIGRVASAAPRKRRR